MKNLLPKLAALARLLTLNAQLSTAHAQGSLTPPGAPAPTMKTLDQIEARQPINAAPFTINAPGSYYLTGNLSVTNGDGIIVNTNQVTIDLNGFTISSTASPANGYAVKLAHPAGNSDVTVLNGHIKGGVTNGAGGALGGPGFYSEIDSPGLDPVNCRVAGVSVSGCSGLAIYLGVNNSTAVDSCTVRSCGSGITADTVTRCTVLNAPGGGIYGVIVSDCRGESSANSVGIQTTIANNCYGKSATGYGLVALTVNNSCGITGGPNGGVHAGGGVVIGSYGSSATGSGLLARIANSCVVGGGTTNVSFKYNMP